MRGRIEDAAETWNAAEPRVAALPPLAEVVCNCVPHNPDPVSISLGMRMLGTPPRVYCASILPFAPTAHCWHVKILKREQMSDVGNK